MTSPQPEPTVLRLDDLEAGPDDHPGDPGTEWHPRADKEGVRDADGLLLDLDAHQGAEHTLKPEAAEHYDGALTRYRVARELGSAEDSDHTPGGVV